MASTAHSQHRRELGPIFKIFVENRKRPLVVLEARKSWRCTRFATMAPAGREGGRKEGEQLSAGISLVRCAIGVSVELAIAIAMPLPLPLPMPLPGHSLARSFAIASAKTAISPLCKPQRRKNIEPPSLMIVGNRNARFSFERARLPAAYLDLKWRLLHSPLKLHETVALNRNDKIPLNPENPGCRDLARPKVQFTSKYKVGWPPHYSLPFPHSAGNSKREMRWGRGRRRVMKSRALCVMRDPPPAATKSFFAPTAEQISMGEIDGQFGSEMPKLQIGDRTAVAVDC